MNSQANQDTPVKPGQPQPTPPGKEEEKGRHGEGGGQPKPEIPDIPQEIPAREIDRKPSDPQSQPDQGPKQEIPDKGESEENNDVEEKDPSIAVEDTRNNKKDVLVEDDRDTNNESLVDSRDRFPFPNKQAPYKTYSYGY